MLGKHVREPVSINTEMWKVKASSIWSKKEEEAITAGAG